MRVKLMPILRWGEARQLGIGLGTRKRGSSVWRTRWIFFGPGRFWFNFIGF